jgi:putative restriction endonuclease
MRLWVGVTDKNWFEFLRARDPDEVNFWQPNPKALATFLSPGVPFLFKLHAPDNFVVGGGFFVRYSALPGRLAWEAFGEKNGVTDYAALRDRVAHYRKERVRGDPVIGCNVLNGPFFFPDEEWIPVPETWAPNIVRGRTFDTDEPDGARLWAAVSERLERRPANPNVIEDSARFGAQYLARARLGQGAFRVLVTEAYQRRCAITGEKTLPVLEAAHIRPYADHGPHLVANGMLLRADLHTLLDAGYVTVTEQLRIEVSKRIREEFENGKEYYKHHGSVLVTIPVDANERPSQEFLRWHNEQRFLG